MSEWTLADRNGDRAMGNLAENAAQKAVDLDAEDRKYIIWAC